MVQNGPIDEQELERKWLVRTRPRFLPSDKSRLVSVIQQGWFTEPERVISLTRSRMTIKGSSTQIEIPSWVAIHLMHDGGKLRIRSEISRASASRPPAWTLNTKRSTGTAGVLEEWEHPITETDFSHVWSKCKLKLAKQRRNFNRAQDSELPPCKLAVCDIFHKELIDLALIEAEFDNEDQMRAFMTPPSWAEYDPREVTTDSRFTNFALARLRRSELKRLLKEFYPDLNFT